MKHKNMIFWGLMFFLFLFMLENVSKAANFDAWTGAPSLFTIGRTESVNIYVRNRDPSADSFNVTNYTKNNIMKQGQSVPHLVSVSVQSYQIKELKENETGDTFAKIVIIAPIDNGGSVTFNITSVSDPNVYREVSVGLTAGSPIVLSEYGNLGLIQMFVIIILILVVSYASHFS